MDKKYSRETLCVQAGWTPKKGEPRVLPIYQSTTFKYDTSEQMARLFDLERFGIFLYTLAKTPPMMPSPQKSQHWKVVWVLC